MDIKYVSFWWRHNDYHTRLSYDDCISVYIKQGYVRNLEQFVSLKRKYNEEKGI